VVGHVARENPQAVAGRARGSADEARGERVFLVPVVMPRGLGRGAEPGAGRRFEVEAGRAGLRNGRFAVGQHEPVEAAQHGELAIERRRAAERDLAGPDIRAASRPQV
jgi:hypothetical protein